ncbi:MAG: OsmC-like protein [Chloroflexi bacterium]|nr:MAG: OsmC-like protein [Chloroflexota bacterium]
MKEVGICSAKVHVEMDYYLKGSVADNTVKNGVTEIRSFFDVESEQQEEDLIEVIRLAKKGCFAENLVKTGVPLKSVCTLNGPKVNID